MKIKYISMVVLTTIVVISLISCDNYEQFEKELYQNDIYIVSGRDYNIFDLEVYLDSSKVDYNISVSASGTTKISQDVKVTFKRDEALLTAYNFANFDLEEAKYAKELPLNKYNFPDESLMLKVSDEEVYSKYPLVINPKDLYDLKPDSVYFIPVAIDTVSAYSISRTKRGSLVRILPRNRYATSKKTTMYILKGYKGTTDYLAEEINASYSPINSSNKVVQPLTNNSVKMNVGILSFADANKATHVDVDRMAMVVTVNDDKSLSLKPYNEDAGLLEVEMLPMPEGIDEREFVYKNRYEETPDRYVPGKLDQRFLMYYKYRTRNTTNDNWSDWTFILEASNDSKIINSY
ncbi:MAG: DUF1735 domain-containing protein [Dysgonomonas sp.]|nr:DUF1735 domain-containing protein [Dysgonomonas sp.]